MMWSKTHKEHVRGGYRVEHLFVFYNGIPIYKRHNPGCHGIIFDAFGPPWSPHEFDQNMERLTAPPVTTQD